MTKTDVLNSLAPYYSDGIQVSDIEKVKVMHDIFYTDFFICGVYVDGVKVKVKPYKYTNSSKDGLSMAYEMFTEKFVHIITRTVKASNWKMSTKIREFREERANRIHWIRPILENCADSRITRFKYMEADGREREYFWYRAKQYIVILEHNRSFDLITGFCVDAENQPYYQKKYINRVKD